MHPLLRRWASYPFDIQKRAVENPQPCPRVLHVDELLADLTLARPTMLDVDLDCIGLSLVSHITAPSHRPGER